MVMLGHDGPPTNYYTENLVSGEPLAECPLRTLLRAAESNPALASEVTRHTEDYFPAYEAGHLLVAGGVADQPGRTLDYMQELTTLRVKSQAKFDEIRTKEDEQRNAAPQMLGDPH